MKAVIWNFAELKANAEIPALKKDDGSFQDSPNVKP